MCEYCEKLLRPEERIEWEGLTLCIDCFNKLTGENLKINK